MGKHNYLFQVKVEYLLLEVMGDFWPSYVNHVQLIQKELNQTTLHYRRSLNISVEVYMYMHVGIFTLC